MALKKCKECGGEVSSDAKTCPHCGATQNKTNWKAIGYMIAAVYAIGFVNWLIKGTPEPTPKTEYTTVTKTEKVDSYGIKEGSVIHTHNRAWWKKEYGGSLPANFKINLWENSKDWGGGKGKVKGYTLPENNLVVLTVNNGDYMVSDRQTGTMGWISKMQIER